MQGCKFIMDIKEAFDLVTLLSDASTFIVRLWTVENTIEALGLQNHKELMDVCMLSGNDFTGPYHEQIWRGRRYWIQDVVKKYNNEFNKSVPLAQCINLQQVLVSKLELREAIELSEKMYTLESLYELYSMNELTPLTQYILARTTSGMLPRRTLALHNGYDWGLLIFEDSWLPHNIQQWCDPLLSIMGAMCTDKAYIEVYGRASTRRPEKGQAIRVECAPNEWLPKLIDIEKIDLQRRKLLFDNIAAMNEAPVSQAPSQVIQGFFEEFGLKDGFVMYAINYLIQLHKKHKYDINEWEIAAMLQTALRQKPGNERDSAFVPRWQKPSVRCLTLANWYQYTLQLMHCLAVFLQVGNFPEPKDCFSGTYFSSLYMTFSKDKPKAMDKHIQTALQQLSK